MNQSFCPAVPANRDCTEWADANHFDGTPVVQYEIKTGKRKALAFLHAHFWEKYGDALDGSFGNALDEKGERFFISWDGWRKGQPRGWESAAITVVHIPASERQ